MRLVIFGATGRTGRILVRAALAQGHEVTAFVRDPAKLEKSDERLRVVPGDAHREADVERAIAGADAVLMALGHTDTSRSDVLACAADHIVTAARKHGNPRVIALTSGTLRDPDDRPSFVQRLLTRVAWLFFRVRFADAARQAETIRTSGLDWVLVRAAGLTDGPARGTYRAGFIEPGLSATVARADVAAFMLDQLEDDAHLGRTPFVSY